MAACDISLSLSNYMYQSRPSRRCHYFSNGRVIINNNLVICREVRYRARQGTGPAFEETLGQALPLRGKPRATRFDQPGPVSVVAAASQELTDVEEVFVAQVPFRQVA